MIKTIKNFFWRLWNKNGFDVDALVQMNPKAVTVSDVAAIYHVSNKYAQELLDRCVATGNLIRKGDTYTLSEKAWLEAGFRKLKHEKETIQSV